MCVDEHVAILKERRVFRAETRISRKRSNHAKFVSEFARYFRREIPVQLNASHTRGSRSIPNFVGAAVNENTDCIGIRWQCFDNFTANIGFNVAWASGIKVKSDQLCA